MHVISLSRITALTNALASLPKDGDASLRVLFPMFTALQEGLDDLIKGLTIPLETIPEDAQNLLDRVNTLFERHFIDSATRQISAPDDDARVLESHDVVRLGTLASSVENWLGTVLKTTLAFAPLRCGLYPAHDLVVNAQGVFSPEIRALLPQQALTEFDRAGRALAFDMPVAVGLHLLRSVELVVHAWAESFLQEGNRTLRRERTWTSYLKRLSLLGEGDAGAVPSKHLLHLLNHLREGYRNPLLMADESLTRDQAAALFSLASGALSLMAEDLRAAPKRTANTKVRELRSSESTNVKQQPQQSVVLAVQPEAKPPMLMESPDGVDSEEEGTLDLRIAQSA